MGKIFYGNEGLISLFVLSLILCKTVDVVPRNVRPFSLEAFLSLAVLLFLTYPCHAPSRPLPLLFLRPLDLLPQFFPQLLRFLLPPLLLVLLEVDTTSIRLRVDCRAKTLSSSCL